jgi:OmpA-OmpF porin, OOP family
MTWTRGRAWFAAIALIAATAGCADSDQAQEPTGPEPTDVADDVTDVEQDDAQEEELDPSEITSEYDFPPIPAIVVPNVLNFDDSDAALQELLGDDLQQLDGDISVYGAECTDGGVLASGDGLRDPETGRRETVDGERTVRDHGSWAEITDDSTHYRDFESHTVLEVNVGTEQEGSIIIYTDGSAVVRGPGGYVRWSTDGSVDSGGGPGGSIRIEPDGSARCGGCGPGGTLLDNDGAGGGEWGAYGALGKIINNGDGTGTWSGGPHGREIINNGDGTGTLQESSSDDPVPIELAPLPPVPPIDVPPRPEDFAPIGRPCGSVVRLDESVLFEFGESDLRPEAAPVLDEVAAVIIERDARVEVIGHTDSIGDEASNQVLSEDRADAVRTALLERGVADDITATGRGKTEPIAPNVNADGSDNPAGRQLNRRVEIAILDR